MNQNYYKFYKNYKLYYKNKKIIGGTNPTEEAQVNDNNEEIEVQSEEQFQQEQEQQNQIRLNVIEPQRQERSENEKDMINKRLNHLRNIEIPALFRNKNIEYIYKNKNYWNKVEERMIEFKEQIKNDPVQGDEYNLVIYEMKIIQQILNNHLVFSAVEPMLSDDENKFSTILNAVLPAANDYNDYSII